MTQAAAESIVDAFRCAIELNADKDLPDELREKLNEICNIMRCLLVRSSASNEHGACWRCRWFDRDAEESADGGYCRRYPPVSANNGTACMWSGVEYIDWCGEFMEADEEWFKQVAG